MMDLVMDDVGMMDDGGMMEMDDGFKLHHRTPPLGYSWIEFSQ